MTPEKQEVKAMIQHELLEIVRDAQREAAMLKDDPSHRIGETLRILAETISKRIADRGSS